MALPQRPAMTVDPTVDLGPISLSTPLVAASGTVGSVWEFAGLVDVSSYGALVAKSVSEEPWPGRPPPRLAPAGLGMLNRIGIQNPGIEAWQRETAPRLGRISAPVWGSAVGKEPAEFGRVAAGLETAGVAAVEVNLSCPNLEDGRMFSLDPAATRDVVREVVAATSLPVGAKLTPNSEDIVAVAQAAIEAGASWLTLTNTVWGGGIDIETREPLVSGMVGGYSGPPIKPIAIRCVLEVARALPGVPILGCGGIVSGKDVVEYLLAGASAVAIGTIHFAEPRAASRILAELIEWCESRGVSRVSELTGGALQKAGSYA